jgi:protein-S-isoprenylcysteine O-methyltransferase Ste14
MKVICWMDVCVFLAITVFVASRERVSTRYIIGLGMAISGVALVILARVQLGRSFTLRAEAKKLVTKGLYSKFRHPIYFFGGIAYLGLLIVWGKLIPLLCFLVIYPLLQIPRARKEGKVLEQAFGEEYRRYKVRTWF